jgi:hypothetical protein
MTGRLLDEQGLRCPGPSGLPTSGRHLEVGGVDAVRLDPTADVRVMPTDNFKPETA